MDISDFFDTFFEEAQELLDDMERHLLALDLDNPDSELLHAIFRAAHSIKGGAGTFGLDILQQTTHLLENLLDHARHGEMTLRRDIVDTFLETKDMLQEQLDAYRAGEEPDSEAFERICRVLQLLAQEEMGQSVDGAAPAVSAGPEAEASTDAAPVVDELAADSAALADEATVTLSSGTGGGALEVALFNVSEKDRGLLIEELGQLGTVHHHEGDGDCYRVQLETSCSADDIEAVMCFIIDPDQLNIQPLAQVALQRSVAPASTVPDGEKVASVSSVDTESPAKNRAEAKAASTPDKAAASTRPIGKGAAKGTGKGGESTSIRVPVSKVDQIINLVGELIITQSMLDQLKDDSGSGISNGLNLLARNARDLQEAVMSIRMVPMDYVFSRFPRLVRDLASKLDKDVELVTEGESTELDKGLTEGIIDPLTHLVRNSLDHGLETPEKREAAGKPRQGRLTLSAQHQGGNILIEVIDDGAGLNRDRILDKARNQGLPVSDQMSDDEVWQLIFAPGFSTAEAVSDVSGRGVGMDVVKRNIQNMGGHVEVLSTPGRGTSTRIVLPLTLAILDGMSVRVGGEVFIVPVSSVIESLQPRAGELHAMSGGDVLLKVREDYLPVIPVHQALDVTGAITDPTAGIAVIVQAEGRRYAMLVDELVGQQQVVVKNLETNYRKVPGVSAATILGDGSVSLILDVTDLNRLSQRKRKGGPFDIWGASASIKELEHA